jgi:hypothetical protein
MPEGLPSSTQYALDSALRIADDIRNLAERGREAQALPPKSTGTEVGPPAGQLS